LSADHVAPDSFVLIDGGLSTTLHELGVDTSGSLWTAEAAWRRPDDLVRAHRLFVEAGAEVITTASYQCDLDLLARAGADASTARRVLFETTNLARRAIDGSSVRVAVSIGPFGASQADGSEYTGEYGVDRATLERYHRCRLEVLIDSGADLVAVETIPRADEASIVRDLLVEFGAPPAWFSFGVVSPRVTYAGDDLADAARRLVDYPNLVAIGVNCTAPAHVGGALRVLQDLGVPLIAYPNHGRTWNAVDREWVGDETVVDGDVVSAWIEAGATHIGGCCGVGSAGIARLAALRTRSA
jgi:homocysteine S-methyltransferase